MTVNAMIVQTQSSSCQHQMQSGRECLCSHPDTILSTVSIVSPPTESHQQDTAEHACAHENIVVDKGGKGDHTGFVQTDHEESVRESI